MKWIFIAIAVIACTSSCKKDSHDVGLPDGVWVEKGRPSDTLITYRESGRNILFDNSEMYRMTSSQLPSRDFYKWKYMLIPGKIRIKNYPQAAEDYYAYDFVWNIEGKEFSMQALAIRRFLSSTTVRLVYVKVR